MQVVGAHQRAPDHILPAEPTTGGGRNIVAACWPRPRRRQAWLSLIAARFRDKILVAGREVVVARFASADEVVAEKFCSHFAVHESRNNAYRSCSTLAHAREQHVLVMLLND